ARFFGTHDGMEKAYADAKKDVERLQKQLLEPDKPLTKAQAQDLGQQLHTAETTEARRKAALDAVAKGAEQLKDFRRQAAEQQKKMLALMMPSKEQMKEWEEGFAAQERIDDIGVQAQRDELRRRAARSARVAELTAGQETPMAMSEGEKRELSARKEEA